MTETLTMPERVTKATVTDSLSVTDNRTGKTYEFPVSEGTIKATDLRKIKVSDDEGARKWAGILAAALRPVLADETLFRQLGEDLPASAAEGSATARAFP